MLRLVLSFALIATNHLAEPRLRMVPHALVRTPGGDRLGYVPVSHPYTGARRLTGMLIGYDPETGRTQQCGGVVLRSRSRSLVLTAAHCLFHNGRLLRQVDFLPGFEQGRPVLGSWPAVRGWVPPRWRHRPYSPKLLRYDLGLIAVARMPRPLESVTGPGLRPFPTRRGTPLRGLELLGYPAGRHYPGTEQYRCVGDAVEGGPGVLVTRNCHAPAGSSGSPALYGGAIAGVVSSSSPLSDPSGFTVLARTGRVLHSLITRANRALRHRRGAGRLS